MNRKLMEQILALIRQNPFFSAVSVIGTAVSITFVIGHLHGV